MTVYVDDVRHAFGRMIMCHMWADTEEELDAFAARLGLQSRWKQKPPKASWVKCRIMWKDKGMAWRALSFGHWNADKAKFLIASWMKYDRLGT